MKKILISLILISVFSCKKNAKIDYAIISGKIINIKSKNISLLGPDEFKKDIELAEDGMFTDTIKTMGDFSLSGIPLHFSMGDNITLNFDRKDIKNTLNISGKGAGISKYMASKMLNASELMNGKGNVYLKDEADYKSIFKTIKKAHQIILEGATEISEDFRIKEERNIYYEYLVKLYQYKSAHAYYTQKEEFEPSKDFLQELDMISYSLEKDFDYSSYYRELVYYHYADKASDYADANSIDPHVAFLKICATIKNEIIRGRLSYEVAKNVITYTDFIEDYYKAYLALKNPNESQNEKIKHEYQKYKSLAKGNPSPKFSSYENYAGGTTSLDDMEGKYLYIDVWATYCRPCIAEFPFFKKLKQNYREKNIEFVSISVDAIKDYDKWKKMIVDNKLGATQLFSDKGLQSNFMKNYYIEVIPKFILLDPQGNIITANAPRPSEKELIKLFNQLKI